MKFFVALAIILLASCRQQEGDVAVPAREVFDEFQTIMVAGDYEKLAGRLDPDVLREFRRQLEFTTEYPQEGSWFAGTRDRRPSKEELAGISDAAFFTIYMKNHSQMIGNPFAQRYSGGKLVAATTGSKGFEHFVFTKDREYAFPITFSFIKTGSEWRLVEPSVVTQFARQLRATKGGIN